MLGLSVGGWVLCLAAVDAVAILALVLLIRHRARTQENALEDARHEFETGLTILESRLRTRRTTADKLPSIDDEGT
jgi:hypothetical protein